MPTKSEGNLYIRTTPDCKISDIVAFSEAVPSHPWAQLVVDMSDDEFALYRLGMRGDPVRYLQYPAASDLGDALEFGLANLHCRSVHVYVCKKDLRLLKRAAATRKGECFPTKLSIRVMPSCLMIFMLRLRKACLKWLTLPTPDVRPGMKSKDRGDFDAKFPTIYYRGRQSAKSSANPNRA